MSAAMQRIWIGPLDGGRGVEISDEQMAHLCDLVLVADFGHEQGSILVSTDHENVLMEAHDLLTELGGDPNPEYDRALVELCSRVLGLADDDRDLVTLLVRGNEARCTECGNVFDDNPGKTICKTCQDWKVEQPGPYDPAIDDFGPAQP